MSHFLVIYDRATGRARVQEFTGEGSADAALDARFRAERRYTGESTEIASLAAESVDELRATHSRYFQDVPEMVDDLERLIAG